MSTVAMFTGASRGRRTALGLATLAVLALCHASCTEAPAAPDYFPLAPGHRWHYRVLREGVASDAGPDYHEVRTLRPRTLEGERRFRRLDSLGNEYYFSRDANGIQRVAMRNAMELSPQFDAPPREVLPMPLDVGRSWASSTHPYAIFRLVPFGGVLTGRYTLTLTFSVEALDAVVDTPAGRFEDCLMIRGEGTLELYGDARRGFIPVPVTHTEWYAPGVGLVKLLREESVDTDVFQGGRITFELTDYR
jgi:hypothetical protein